MILDPKEYIKKEFEENKNNPKLVLAFWVVAIFIIYQIFKTR
jgi:hypothetical protein